MPHRSKASQNVSAWESSVALPVAPALDRDLATEVCVVGAGISGLTTAYLLAQQGRSVVVLDRGPLVAGETKHTTAHLANAIDDRFSLMEEMHGAKGSFFAAQSHGQAIDLIERIVHDEGIDCDFERVDGYLFLGEDHTVELLEEEMEAAHRAGLDSVQKLDQAPVRGFSSGPCLVFPRQGQFHPLHYLSGLIERCRVMGVAFFSNTAVTDVQAGAVATVSTKAGFTIRAQAAVIATNSPINDRYKMHIKLYPYRTFAVTAKVARAEIDRALYWDTLDTYHYVRLQKWDDETDLLIVGGADHKTGQCDDADDRYRHLEQWARERFTGMGAIEHRWSGQVLETPDGLAYLGRNPGDENVYIATGDSGMGMTHGTIAGMIITDLIQGRENPWASLYDPARKTLRALPAFAEENLNVAMKYGELLTGGDVSSEEEIPAGCGAVVRDGLSKLAIYRAQDGTLHRRSAICPHLGCVVSWNSNTSTWDCPCHGSRFDPKGKVLTGPAVSDLKELE